jgi:HPt (histidine-containing phosphotransfer) domain-containing protein
MMEGEKYAGRADASSEGAVVDWDRALGRVGGNKDALQEIVQLFCVEECPKLVQNIRDGLAKGDAALLERAAHTLKSSADLFGAKRAFDAARSLEELARESDFQGAAGTWKVLEQELPIVQAALAKLET